MLLRNIPKYILGDLIALGSDVKKILPLELIKNLLFINNSGLILSSAWLLDIFVPACFRSVV